MTTILIATISFSLSLLAFCAGACLTIWATSGANRTGEVGAAKLTGYFVTVLALIALVFTSYYAARSMFAKNAGHKGKIKTYVGKVHNKMKHQ